MSLEPITNAPTIIQFHVVCALIALFLGPVAIWRKSRDRVHKISGYIWVLGMLGLAITGLMIPAFDMVIIGTFGPIHAFSILALWSIWVGMRAIWRKDIARHEAALKGLYYQGLLIAGLFNFIPGRTINRAVMGEYWEMGWFVIVAGGVGLVILAVQQRQKRVAAMTMQKAAV